MNALMNPILPPATPKMPAETKSAEGRASGSSFSEYVERSMNEGRKQAKNLLGTKTGKVAGAVNQTTGAGNKTAMSGSENRDAVSVADLLSRFMQELREIAEKVETGPGEWSLSLPDTDLLQKMAIDAGMDEGGLSLLLQQMENQAGKIDLGDFLTTLAKHFEELQEVKPVTVPETDLPFLEILLSRMGVGPQELKQISDQAVTGDNQLDLAKFLQGLEKVHGEHLTTLTDWEAEQLQDILDKAGVSQQLQRALLPERNPFLQIQPGENKPVNLTLTRLGNMLRQGLNEVEAGRLKADLPAFLSDLHEILFQAGFEEKTAGWSPAVQEAAAAIYDKLLESVDLSKVDLSKVEVNVAEKPLRMIPEQQEENSGSWFESPEENSFSGLFDDADFTGRDTDLADHDQQSANGEEILKPFEQASSRPVDHAPVHGMDASANETMDTASEPKPSVAAFRLPPQLQRQTFEQLSQSVIKGLQNNDHHLVLRLHPRELGEVKVEMLVRDEQIAISFSMENSKVKDILESNMDQFRDNLEKQGFVLEECMVSLGRHSEPDDAWRQFEFAWKNHQAGIGKTSLADLPDDALYHRSPSRNNSEQGIDLFA